MSIEEEIKMSIERAITAFAGIMILLSVVLTVYIDPLFMWLTVFVGANLFQSSLTGFCPAAVFMKKVFGLKCEKEIALEKK